MRFKNTFADLRARARWFKGLLLLCCVGLGISSEAASARWIGNVVYVTDGDTLWVKGSQQGSDAVKVRLIGIDAPEICQPFGMQARDGLLAQLLGQEVVVIGRRTDDYGRLLARIQLRGQDMGQWLVSHGLAWSYRYRKSQGPYINEELQARAARVGLWQDDVPMPPMVFRHKHGSCY